MYTDWVAWSLFLIGYAICSGSNVAYFAFSLRDLQRMVARAKGAPPDSEAARQGKRAAALLKHLENPNWTLAAILLTNVAFGVQLSQLSDQLFPGVLAVIMPVISITIIGEFFAQATFLRYAGPICSFFSPFIWLLKWITVPISYPLAWAVDTIYGREAIRRLNEQELLSDLQLELTEFKGDANHTHEEILDPRELKAMMNVARADDEPARSVGERLDANTVLKLPFDRNKPVFPDDLEQFVSSHLDVSTHPWFVLTDAENGEPRLLLDADGFIREWSRDSRHDDARFNPHDHTFRAEVFRDPDVKLGQVISDFQVRESHPGDDVIDIDVALIWTPEKRWILTGGDVLGRLLRGVARRRHWRVERDVLGRSKTDQ